VTADRTQQVSDVTAPRDDRQPAEGAAPEAPRRRRIAVVSLDTRLNGDTMGATRYSYIASMLAHAGYEVDLITSSFQHWEKRQRDLSTFRAGSEGYNVVFIKEPGYSRNVELKRIWSHGVAVRHLDDYLTRYFDYDLVYCQIPPNNIARSMAETCADQGVPFIVDVNDLWPEAMRMAFDVPVVSDILFSGFKRDAKAVYRRASAVVGTSEEYADRPFQDRARDIPRLVVYVGSDLSRFDEGVRQHEGRVSRPADEFWVTYAGTVGKSYDLPTLVRAAAELKDRGYGDVRVKILGDGPQRPEVEELAAQMDGEVEFLGHCEYGLMAAYLANSDIAVNSLVKGSPQSIPAKISDYLASGRPMINTSESPEFCAKVDADGFGVNVPPEEVGALADAIARLHDDPALCRRMGARARDIATEQFDRVRSYHAIEDLVSRLIEGSGDEG